MSRLCLPLLISGLLVMVLGCGPATPRSKLTGEWKGAPDISGEIEQFVEAQGNDEGKRMLAEGFGKTIGSFAARQAMGVDLNLEGDGSASIGGQSQAVLTVAPGQKGKWEVSDNEPATMKIALGDKVFEGKVTFRDEDAFFFQFEIPLEGLAGFTDVAVEAQKQYDEAQKQRERESGKEKEEEPESEPQPTTKPITMLFRRKGALREM
jgi:hypothetical protein